MVEWTGKPAYIQIADDLRTQAAEMQVGDKLPSQSALAKQYGVSSTAAKDAIDELVKEGIVVTHQGKGVFIRQVPIRDAGGNVEAQPSGFDAVMLRLDRMEQEMRRLAEQVAALDADRPKGGRRGPSGR